MRPYNKKEHSFSNGTEQGGINKAARVYPTKYGVDIIMPTDVDKLKQHITPEQIGRVFERIPAAVMKHCPKEIELVDYRNPMDEYWEKQYNIKGLHSFATGSPTGVTFYDNYRDYTGKEILWALSHEVGHSIDRKLNSKLKKGKWNFSDSSDWSNAMEKDNVSSGAPMFVSEYSRQSKSFHEDFADSIQQYVIDRDRFKRSFPHRFELIEEVLDEI